MKTSTLLSLTTAIILIPSQAFAESAPRDDIIVNGIVEQESDTAIGMPLTLREIPQSVTIIDEKRIKDFALNNINDVIDQTVGVNVERAETDRTYYTARGFEVSNFEVDGIGLPLLFNIQYGDLDTALFERVEVIRGANALSSGIGTPAATINYVRKRPTEELRSNISGRYGKWDQWRAEADISGPINSSGTLAARLIYAHDEGDSYLDYRHTNRNVYGAILSWNASPDLTATVGYTRQENDATGVMWGALPLVYADGGRIDYPRSSSSSQDWTYWDQTNQSAFAELAYELGNGWDLRGTFTYNGWKGDAKLLYGYGYPDRNSHEGIFGMVGYYPDTSDQYLGDVVASGPFTAFGREHELSIGLSSAYQDYIEAQGLGATIQYPGIPGIDTYTIDEPAVSEALVEADTHDELQRAYVAMHLNLSDRLKVLLGASAMWLTTSGTSYGEDAARDESALSPYFGLTYDLTKNISLYASYTNIFNPQNEVDDTRQRLDPVKGSSIEGGIKSEWLDGRLYATAALFKAKQNNLAEAAGQFANGDTYYAGVDTTSKGFEIEVNGRITDHWTLSGGYTGIDIENDVGEDTRIYVPTKSLKLASTYTIPELNDLQFGAQLRWQNAVRQDGIGPNADITVSQDDYAVLDLMAGVNVVDNLRATVNLRNVTNADYLASLMWTQALYGAPRSISGSLTYTF
ncbi:TonB-dependent siderophore receptor [Altericroceibacterium spongiae]|uniref:TonB-dependent siderophore receptor n=1 Tax=Altericroceibacterium spongiae TaxID=2320269 RepID=A0A420EPG7_9SPHN|nr:TonB-dependent siderophore receptor [Altericroceibacterium spongiae]RKF22575.1 TonB-dependent siderophore receptor [Altericroceibacterium spongiae]